MALFGVLLLSFVFSPIATTSAQYDCGTSSLDASTLSTYTLSSPGNSGRETYPPNAECAWTIKAPSSELRLLVELTFTSFDTYGNPTCGASTDDVLEIYDSSSKSNMLGKYCGNYLPAKVVSSGSYLHLVFKSSNRLFVYKNGFSLQYKAIYSDYNIWACSPFNSKGKTQYISLQGSSNTKYIKSPLYPNKYPSNIECTWFIKVDDTKKIKLKVKKLNIFNYKTPIPCKSSSNADSLSVYDGLTTFSTKLKSYCSPSSSSTTLTSSGRHLTIRFKSNSDNYFIGNIAGFEVEYTEVVDPSHCGTSDLKAITTGAYTLRYPGNDIQETYPPNARCLWTIQAPTDKVVELNFTAFDTYGSPTCDASTDDVLEIYNSFSTSADEYDVIGKYCGGYLPAKVISSFRFLTLVFKSANRLFVNKKGFRLQYKAIDKPYGKSVCLPISGEYVNKQYINVKGSSVTKYIKSPLYPNKYPSKIECIWYIKVAHSKIIQLKIKTLNIFNYKTPIPCKSSSNVDSLTVYDGMTTFDTKLKSYCSPSSSSTTITSSRNYLTIRFKSNSDNYFIGNTAGFEVEYTEVVDPDPSHCGTSDLKAITTGAYTLRYPGNDIQETYPPNARCLWTIQAPTDKVVELNFTAFDTYGSPTCDASTDDVLEIYNSFSTSADDHDVIGKYCGGYLPAKVISSFRFLTLVFKSANRLFVNKKGFRLQYKAIDKPHGKSVCLPINGEAANNQYINLKGSSVTKYIKSPLYPNKYPSNIECIWYIKVAHSKKIQLKVKTLNIFNYKTPIPCKSSSNVDSLIVYDGMTTVDTKLKSYCSPSSSSTTITSSGSDLTIRFKSNYDNYFTGNKAGFEVEYTEVKGASNLNVAEVIGCIFGGIFFVGLIVCCAYYLVRRKRYSGHVQRGPDVTTMQTTPPTTTTTNAPEYPMQGGFGYQTLVNPPAAQVHYPGPPVNEGEASCPPEIQGVYNPAALTGQAGGHPYPVPSDPPPPYPGPPAYPPQANQPYNPQGGPQQPGNPQPADNKVSGTSQC